MNLGDTGHLANEVAIQSLRLVVSPLSERTLGMSRTQPQPRARG